MSVIEEILVPGPARALAGLLNPDGVGHDRRIGDGWELPLLWHCVYLLDRPAQHELGPEGHPLQGISSPPAPGMRRMFAGGRVRVERPLVLGEPATRISELADTRDRTGRSGKLTFVTVRHTITQRRRVAVIDEQDIVYRAVDPGLPPTEPVAAHEPAPRAGTFDVDSRLLFRFSALTYNAHRIHYDRDFAREVEGYPDLLVHGPLQAILMAERARYQAGSPDGPRSFGYRLTSPLFLGQGLAVNAERAAGEIRTSVCDGTGRCTASGSLTG